MVSYRQNNPEMASYILDALYWPKLNLTVQEIGVNKGKSYISNLASAYQHTQIRYTNYTITSQG